MYLVQTSRHRSQEFNWTSECSSFASQREDARGLGTNSSLERQSVVRLQLTPTSRHSNVLMQVRVHLDLFVHSFSQHVQSARQHCDGYSRRNRAPFPRDRGRTDKDSRQSDG
jgi:hypothetical protein